MTVPTSPADARMLRKLQAAFPAALVLTCWVCNQPGAAIGHDPERGLLIGHPGRRIPCRARLNGRQPAPYEAPA